jgi:hypothetical protein
MTDIEAKLEEITALGKRAIAAKDALDAARREALEASKAYDEATHALRDLLGNEIITRVGGVVAPAYEYGF